MKAPQRQPEALDDEAVARFLRAHPSFLSERPDLYRALTPPQRLHGETLADHMAAMLRAERAHAARMSDRVAGVLSARRAAAGLAWRAQEAVLALIRAGDPAECIAVEWPGLLGLDSASLCMEAETMPHARRLPLGSVDAALGGRDVLFRSAPDDAALFHGEAAPLARHDALARVPAKAPAVIALAARDKTALDPAQGCGALAFLGRAAAARLAQ